MQGAVESPQGYAGEEMTLCLTTTIATRSNGAGLARPAHQIVRRSWITPMKSCTPSLIPLSQRQPPSDQAASQRTRATAGHGTHPRISGDGIGDGAAGSDWPGTGPRQHCSTQRSMSFETILSALNPAQSGTPWFRGKRPPRSKTPQPACSCGSSGYEFALLT
jgi:hypothetical protein